MPNVLFVCSRNQWRSRTAEAIYRRDQRLRVRSAGTASSARIRLSAGAVAWADLVFVMEARHRDILVERFGAHLGEAEVIVLEIPDEYRYQDPELVELLRDGVEPYLS